ncbi:RecX family transcriptional regulator [Paenibacillus beijingensis]|uniref:Regulatory protein RecX n=1 Tax=Paenibacillus beijingensis TaxID=1126833 RepID=A0A0D5NSL8_9BACL|nr:RecX family transcriptional regulator [Paenibacillus beijingensis]
MLLTKVEPDRKHRSRYLLYFDGSDEAALSVHEDILVRYRLLKGQTLDAALLAEVAAEDGRYRAYAAAVYYLGFKPRTSKEIERYLARKEFDEESISHTLDRLNGEALINDGEYARMFAAQRMRGALKGRRLIRQELQVRGIAKETAAKAAEALDPQAELDAAMRAAEKKWRSLKGEPIDRKRKLTAFLLRRGFPGETARAAVRSISEGEQGDDEGLWLDN